LARTAGSPVRLPRPSRMGSRIRGEAIFVLFIISWVNLGVVASKRDGEDERLIGWKGETYHSHLCWGKRSQCYGVNALTARKANRYGVKDVASTYLYRYPKEPASAGNPEENSGLDDTYTHMAMIEALPNGTMLVIWQAGKGNEGTKDQHFMLSYSLDTEGIEWSKAMRLEVIGGNGFALWGPVLFADAVGNSLWLFYSENTGECHSNFMDWPPGGDIKAIQMDLKTQQWSEPMMLYAQEEDEGIPKVTANKPTELSTGEWLLPFWRERALVGKSSECQREMKGQMSAGVLRSKDRGKNWEAHGYLVADKTWLIENAIAEVGGEGEALMVFRTSIGRIYQSRSKDGGVTWSAAAPLAELPNPNSKVDLMHLTPGRELVLVYNNHAKARSKAQVGQAHAADLVQHGCKKCRTFLTVAISSDGGAHWKEVASVESEVGETLRAHYPTLLQRGCEVYVAYSRFHKTPLAAEDERYVDQGIKLARVALCGKQF